MFPNHVLAKAFAISFAALATAVLACNGALLAAAQDKDEKEHAAHEHAAAASKAIDKAVCVLAPTQGNEAKGVVTFTRQADGILIEANLENLKPDTQHGFHIHEFGDLTSPDGTALGGHFNPAGAPHGAPDADARHAGDFGNVKSDASGKATYSRVDKHITFDGEDCILGRGMVLHEKEDDLSTQPTGNAGARIATGVIGVAQIKKPQ
ncbi:MAG: superoxide dismutase family protein [Candidatus Hydrogenedentes bacterium]|nr:superoxide dismutase family protein [Candidatus Hydrogenedentota bacterium]